MACRSVGWHCVCCGSRPSTRARGAAHGLLLCMRTYRARSEAKLLDYRNLAVSSRNVLAKESFPASLHICSAARRLYFSCSILTDQTPATIDGWRLLANRGVADAQFYLGTLYDLGLGGVRQDFVEAVKWYQLAAEQGDPRAQSSLAFFYIRGQGGVVRDLVQAHKWLSVSASRFRTNAAAQHVRPGLQRWSGAGGEDARFHRGSHDSQADRRGERLARKWSPR